MDKPDAGPRRNADPQEVFGRLAAMLQMEERLRKAPKKELPFIVANETRLLVNYRQAALWRASADEAVAPMAVSGLAVPDANAPYLQWLGRLCRHLHQKWSAPEPQASPGPEAAAAAAAPEITGPGRGASRSPSLNCGESLAFTAPDLPPNLREDWADWLPAYGLFVPLPLWPAPEPPPGDQAAEARPALFGALTLFGQNPFTAADLRVLAHLAGAYGQALSLAFSPRGRRSPGRSKLFKVAAAMVVLLCLLPLRQTVLAPAEVIAVDPWPVRSPLDGVVERIVVEPNAPVKKGQTLLTLDRTELDTRLVVASKSLEIARAELRQARQQALGDREAKLRLAALSGRLEQLEAEKAYVESLLERATLTSPIDGLALVDVPEEWAGQPVTLGQRIMTVADPGRVRLEIFLPMDEYLPQAPGDEVLFFPNISPGSPRRALIYQVGFQAEESDQAGLAFRLRGDFPAGHKSLRLGVRGSAKLYGSRAPLIYIILRKPLAKLRQWLGF